MMDLHLQRLQELQVLDSRVAGLERKLEAIPTAYRASATGFTRRRRRWKRSGRGSTAPARRCGREKDLEYQAAQRRKLEGQALRGEDEQGVLGRAGEIERRRSKKDRIEEEILRPHGAQERLGRGVVEGDARLRPQEAEARVRRPPPPRSCGA